jgi:hypothetical protein
VPEASRSANQPSRRIPHSSHRLNIDRALMRGLTAGAITSPLTFTLRQGKLESDMSIRLPNELKGQLRAKIIAYYDALKLQALEDFDRRFNDGVSAQESLTVPEISKEPATSLEESRAPQHISSNGGASVASAKPPSARRMMLDILPDFIGKEFTQGALKDRIVGKWPEADSKNLASRISQQLKKLFDEDKVKRLRRGKRIQDPIVYRMTEAFEETLVKR